jgi:hypothetical protein
MQRVHHLPQLEHIVLLASDDETHRLLDVDHLLQVTLQ